MATSDSLLVDVLGDKTATAFSKALDLNTVGQLLRHYPRRFAQRGELTDLSRLQAGEQVTVLAEIAAVNVRRMQARRLTIVEVTIKSGNSRAKLAFFNQPWRERELRVGRWGLFAGKVNRFRDEMQFNSPDYVFTDDNPADVVADFADTLIPVYPAAAELPSWTIARSIALVLASLDPVREPLPAAVIAERGMVDLDGALRHIHRPTSWAEHAQARERLAFDEAFGVQLVMAQRRHRMSANPAVSRPPVAGGLVDAFMARLPFVLTAEQASITGQVATELAAEHPMHRLLQGEVGSGKTVVALLAMLQVVDAGGQAALLAPTEVLAAQHLATVEQLLGPLARAGQLDGDATGTTVTLLTGSLSAPARRAALAHAAGGQAGIVIGTHALISTTVQFADLGLVVVDEQHRFGVEQRDALRAKASAPPHMLFMTATPIPRTVAMTVYGDLEVSEIRTLPDGRQPISTVVVPLAEHPEWTERIWQRITERAAAGQQTYLVCARIGEDDAVDEGPPADLETAPADAEDSDDDAAAGAVATFTELGAGPLSGLRLGLMHGRLPADQRAAVMAEFAAGRLDVLVATTVIEVGVNVPNASMMIIMDADRFGISQLHQLRGRVGRGEAASLCLLVTQSAEGHPARQRLDTVAAHSDGFALAEFDLHTRREGDVLGTSQSGRRSRLKLLSLLADRAIIEAARTEARLVIDADPDLREHVELQEFLWETMDSEGTEFLQKS